MLQIRHAIISEKEKTYNWLCLSDIASMHMGEPDYPESPIPDWTQFQEDFEDTSGQTCKKWLTIRQAIPLNKHFFNSI